MHIIIIYLSILVGTFFEGEMIMLSSVIAAHHGYLNIWLVIIAGAAGTFWADCFYFYLGRKKGLEWLNKKQKIKSKVDFIHKKLDKHSITIFISYRFLYGFRTITPFVIGTSKTKSSTFLIFSILSIIIWALIISSLGYLFGEVIKSKLGYIEHIEKYIIGFLILTGLILILVYRVRKVRIKKLHFLKNQIAEDNRS
jgi:membrane protein DedA with SNARE-associated domain